MVEDMRSPRQPHRWVTPRAVATGVIVAMAMSAALIALMPNTVVARFLAFVFSTAIGVLAAERLAKRMTR